MEGGSDDHANGGDMRRNDNNMNNNSRLSTELVSEVDSVLAKLLSSSTAINDPTLAPMIATLQSSLRSRLASASSTAGTASESEDGGVTSPDDEANKEQVPPKAGPDPSRIPWKIRVAKKRKGLRHHTTGMTKEEFAQIKLAMQGADKKLLPLSIELASSASNPKVTPPEKNKVVSVSSSSSVKDAAVNTFPALVMTRLPKDKGHCLIKDKRDVVIQSTNEREQYENVYDNSVVPEEVQVTIISPEIVSLHKSKETSPTKSSSRAPRSSKLERKKRMKTANIMDSPFGGMMNRNRVESNHSEEDEEEGERGIDSAEEKHEHETNEDSEGQTSSPEADRTNSNWSVRFSRVKSAFDSLGNKEELPNRGRPRFRDNNNFSVLRSKSAHDIKCGFEDHGVRDAGRAPSKEDKDKWNSRVAAERSAGGADRMIKTLSPVRRKEPPEGEYNDYLKTVERFRENNSKLYSRPLQKNTVVNNNNNNNSKNPFSGTPMPSQQLIVCPVTGMDSAPWSRKSSRDDDDDKDYQEYMNRINMVRNAKDFARGQFEQIRQVSLQAKEQERMRKENEKRETEDEGEEREDWGFVGQRKEVDNACADVVEKGQLDHKESEENKFAAYPGSVSPRPARSFNESYKAYHHLPEGRQEQLSPLRHIQSSPQEMLRQERLRHESRALREKEEAIKRREEEIARELLSAPPQRGISVSTRPQTYSIHNGFEAPNNYFVQSPKPWKRPSEIEEPWQKPVVSFPLPQPMQQKSDHIRSMQDRYLENVSSSSLDRRKTLPRFGPFVRAPADEFPPTKFKAIDQTVAAMEIMMRKEMALNGMMEEERAAGKDRAVAEAAAIFHDVARSLSQQTKEEKDEDRTNLNRVIRTVRPPVEIKYQQQQQQQQQPPPRIPARSVSKLQSETFDAFIQKKQQESSQGRSAPQERRSIPSLPSEAIVNSNRVSADVSQWDRRIVAANEYAKSSPTVEAFRPRSQMDEHELLLLRREDDNYRQDMVKRVADKFEQGMKSEEVRRPETPRRVPLSSARFQSLQNEATSAIPLWAPPPPPAKRKPPVLVRRDAMRMRTGYELRQSKSSGSIAANVVRAADSNNNSSDDDIRNVLELAKKCSVSDRVRMFDSRLMHVEDRDREKDKDDERERKAEAIRREIEEARVQKLKEQKAKTAGAKASTATAASAVPGAKLRINQPAGQEQQLVPRRQVIAADRDDYFKRRSQDSQDWERKIQWMKERTTKTPLYSNKPAAAAAVEITASRRPLPGGILKSKSFAGEFNSTLDEIGERMSHLCSSMASSTNNLSSRAGSSMGGRVINDEDRMFLDDDDGSNSVNNNNIDEIFENLLKINSYDEEDDNENGRGVAESRGRKVGRESRGEEEEADCGRRSRSRSRRRELLSLESAAMSEGGGEISTSDCQEGERRVKKKVLPRQMTWAAGDVTATTTTTRSRSPSPQISEGGSSSEYDNSGS